MVKEMLKIPCAVLMGANIANEVASEQYCEATIGKWSSAEIQVRRSHCTVPKYWDT